jgi:hypothetical protein
MTVHEHEIIFRDIELFKHSFFVYLLGILVSVLAMVSCSIYVRTRWMQDAAWTFSKGKAIVTGSWRNFFQSHSYLYRYLTPSITECPPLQNILYSFLFIVPIRKFTQLVLFLLSWGCVRLSPLGMLAIIWPILPASDHEWWSVWNTRCCD